jgi:hypothetical protein
MVLIIDSARLSAAQIHLLAIIAREDGVSYRFSGTLNSTDSLTRYNGQRGWCQLPIQLDSPHHRFTYFLQQPEKMVSAMDFAGPCTAQSHLHPVTAREDGVRYRFSSAHCSTDSLTRYNKQRRWCQLSIQFDPLNHRFTYFLQQPGRMVSAIDSTRPCIAQVHLHPVTAREDGVSYRFSSTLYNTYSLTSYNSQIRWCQLSIQLKSLQRRFTYFL